MTPLELLSPAKNADIGIAAIRCGADAVYIGGPAFGARHAAGNSVEEIIRLCDFASLYGARIYVTVNTLAESDREREEIVAMMLKMKDKGISAFILQDTSLIGQLLEKGDWTEEFHASTQCAIRTPERALELVGMGFHRLILERELSLNDIRAIRKAVPDYVELEFFVHGALCVCYSGDCYLSEALTGRSANRGECAQPCRSLYDLVDSKGNVLVHSRPLLSLKDLNLIERLPQLADAGIVSFKIEGRLKNESYVKNVVKAYSEALDRMVSARPDCWCRASFGKVRGGFEPDLDKTFNRAYTSLFLDGEKRDWNSGAYAKGMGEMLGKVLAARNESNSGMVLTLDCEAPVHNGDGLCFVDRKGRICGFRADSVDTRGIHIKKTEGLEAGVPVWRNTDISFEKNLENNMPERLLSVNLDIKVSAAGVGITAVREDGSTVRRSFTAGGSDTAQNRERMLSIIRSQLEKTCGRHIFALNSLDADNDIPMMSAAFLNGVRRSLAEDFDSAPIIPAKALVGAKKADFNGKSVHHPRREGELMRTKYCILAQLGHCLKTSADGKVFAKNGLYLRNNGRSVRLCFDCKVCEMVIAGSERSEDVFRGQVPPAG